MYVLDDGQWVALDERIFDDQMYDTTDDCVATIRMLTTIPFVLMLLIMLPIRFWFALNVRDWRDAFVSFKANPQVLPGAGNVVIIQAPGTQMVQQPGMVPQQQMVQQQIVEPAIYG